MALFNTGYGFKQLSGKDQGNRFCQTRGHGVIQSSVRPVPKREVSNFRSWRSLTNAANRWLTLTMAQQDAWDAFAEVTQLNDFQGLNKIVDGETYFVIFNTNNRTFNASTAWFDMPPATPSWAERPAFNPFIAKSNDGNLWFTAATRFLPGTKVVFFAQPPSPAAAYLKRVELIWLDTITFDTGLSIGQQTAAFTSSYRAAFGLASTARAQGNWYLMWQIEDGYMRDLDDACVAPNSATPRPLTLTWLNNHPTDYGYLRGGEIRAKSGKKIITPGMPHVNGMTFIDVVYWEHFVEPGSLCRWYASWYAGDAPGYAFDIPLTYPFTNAITGP